MTVTLLVSALAPISSSHTRKEDREMHIHPHSKRRLRIVGKPGDVRGATISVYDAETGETITNVKAITLHLHVEHVNHAVVTYYEANEEGKLRADPSGGGPIESTITLASPEVDVTACELSSEERKDEPL